MSDFKTRLMDEKQELEERVEKLESFVGTEGFAKIPQVQQDLLLIQLPQMTSYLNTLNLRI